MNQREDILAKAKSQIGYIEGKNNNNKYGSYFNANYVAWCAYFVSWCARQAKISESIFLSSGYVPGIVYWFKNKGLFKTKGSYTPKAGDLIIFDFNSNGTGDHIGIVEKVSGSYVYSIEGNTSSNGENANGDGVWRKGRSTSYSKILGYCTPKYEEEEELKIVPIKIKDKTRNTMIEVDGVYANGTNYIKLRDVEEFAPIQVDWDGTYPTIEINYDKD